MPRKPAVDQSIYMDEAEGFLLEHSLLPLPRSWPPLASEQSQTDRLAAKRKKMDWEDEVRNHPDEPVELPLRKDKDEEDANKERCVICLMALRDRTIVGVCGHEFCFECIGVWASQSRRCPLCSADMAPFLLHDLDEAVPAKFYLPPLPERKLPSFSLPGPSRRQRESFERRREPDELEPDDLDIQVERRRKIYQHELYVKHIASNPSTRFRPNPTPRRIAEDSSLIQRATAFMRRELRVWSLVDAELLTTSILSLLKAVDIRSEPAVLLLAEFLDSPSGPGHPHGAEHFAHELYSFLRSPFKDLRGYDEVTQYDPIPKQGSEQYPSPLSSIRSRSISRSPSVDSRLPKSPRDPRQRDTFLAPPSPGSKRWDEADVWMDPEYVEWLEVKKRRAEERMSRKKARRSSLPLVSSPAREARPSKPVELLPSPPSAPLRMDTDDGMAEVLDNSGIPVLSIRGAAKLESSITPTRLSLLARLAKAKAEAAASNDIDIAPTSPQNVDDTPIKTSSSDPLQSPESALKSPGVRAIVQARLRLRLKLVSEKKAFVYNQNESKAQELRRMLLETRARREAEETDAVLRTMDRSDRAREMRRRLMAETMKAAETESERRARELKEKILGERKAKVLRETLKLRKASQGQEGVLRAAAVSVH
ncbi:MAG: hypothetical protein TREMPRED_003407 [Tremellales sp. Tagirdzhanova-0007]|nr:MAG: hypothetical protein TREMPRED_003407 [Tremellales sp. Tagirdzhanova-0007]